MCKNITTHTSYHNSIVTTSTVNLVHINNNKFKDNNSNVETDSSLQIQFLHHLNIYNMISNNPNYFPKQDHNIQRFSSKSNCSLDNVPLSSSIVAIFNSISRNYSKKPRTLSQKDIQKEI